MHLTGLGAMQADDAQNLAQAPRPRVEAPVCVPVTPQALLGNPLPPTNNSGMYPARCGRANYFAGMPGSITQAHSSPTHCSGRNNAGANTCAGRRGTSKPRGGLGGGSAHCA